ncbi:MAG: hypothetical protein NT047_05860 [Deltaproteobacteria bacterium]|nr:hypothetical protein [Deltaproteobacteria bacterium]
MALSAGEIAGEWNNRIYLDRCLAETSAKTEAERDQKKGEFQKALSRYIDMA